MYGGRLVACIAPRPRRPHYFVSPATTDSSEGHAGQAEHAFKHVSTVGGRSFSGVSRRGRSTRGLGSWWKREWASLCVRFDRQDTRAQGFHGTPLGHQHGLIKWVIGGQV